MKDEIIRLPDNWKRPDEHTVFAVGTLSILDTICALDGMTGVEVDEDDESGDVIVELRFADRALALTAFATVHALFATGEVNSMSIHPNMTEDEMEAEEASEVKYEQEHIRLATLRQSIISKARLHGRRVFKAAYKAALEAHRSAVETLQAVN